MNRPILELTDITHRYAGYAWELSIPQLSIFPGHILGIIGPNGSGKSTLLRIAAGILLPCSGNILLEKQRIHDLSRQEIARKLGYLPQEQTSTYDLTVEAVAFSGRYPFMKAFSLPGARDREAVARSLDTTGLRDFSHRPLSRLSGGERKRAFLASVLAQEPQIMLLDEPVSALDFHHQAHFFRILRRLKSDGIGTAVITHDINLASLFCDSLLLMHGGRISAQGTPGEVVQEDILSRVYQEPVIMGRHSQSGRPTILPRTSEEPPHED